MLPIVRPAEHRDIEQLESLEREARAALVGSRGGDRWLEEHPERSAEWAEIVRSAVALVGTIDEVVVGYLVGTVSQTVATIEVIYVTPPARLVGFGDALLANAVASFIDRDATVVEGTALPGDREMKNLFERAGIKARLITLSANVVDVRVGDP